MLRSNRQSDGVGCSVLDSRRERARSYAPIMRDSAASRDGTRSHRATSPERPRRSLHRGEPTLLSAPMSTDEANISCATVVSQLKATESILGALGYQRFLDSLAAADRDAIASLTAVGWVPISLSHRLVEAGAAVASKPYVEFHDMVIRSTLQTNYKTIWRALMAFTSDEALVARASSMVHRVYDRGEVTAAMLGGGKAVVNVKQWPAMPDRAFFGLRVAIETVMELSRRKGTTVVGHRTADGARYDVAWPV
jgi:hypothetical protein